MACLCTEETSASSPHVCSSKCQNHLMDSLTPPSETVSHRVANLYKTKKFTDLTIHFHETDEKIEVHRLILAMSSPVFESMLFGNSAVGPVLHITEDSPQGFQRLLEYIYCDVTQFDSITTVLEVSYLANKYHMEVLKQHCSLYMQKALDDANYLMIYNAAVTLNNCDLLNKCSKMMEGSADSVFSSDQITQLSRPALKHLLEMPWFFVSEVIVFHAIIAWGRKRLESRVRTITPAELRQEVEEFIPLVRFLLMSTDEYVENVIPADIFTAEENCAILSNIREVKGVVLPSWCCSLREKKKIINALS